MDRKKFLKKSVLGSLGAVASSAVLSKSIEGSAKENLNPANQQVGFNHLPTNEIKTMKSVLHPAQSRGHANHGWLDSHHSFSFANYYNPERMHFGVLRVLNDDHVAPGMGFGTHPHDNMEIISIPLEGDLEHKDNMGNKTVIKEGDIQVMSAGTGIMHSEYNGNKDKAVKFLQIWVFPNTKNVKPRYDQITLDKNKLTNQMHQILSPNPDDEGVWIHQNAWFHLGNLEKGKQITHRLKDRTNGIYAFLLEGKLTIDGKELNKRDGMGVWDIDELTIETIEKASLLLMEVPMKLT